jgi:hypothetical protein
MSDTRRSMLTAEEMLAYRCLAMSIGKTTIYFRRYADRWLRAHCGDDGVWYETAVTADMPATVCGYYPYRTVPLSDYPV